MTDIPDAARIRLWREKPQVMVRDLFHVEPDAWQDDVLADFPSHPSQVMLACKGPGKTTLEAWLSWNFLLTRLHPKIGAVSITGKNLHDNLWPEMAKWQMSCPLLKAQFEWGTEKIYAKEAPQTWFMSAKTWPQSANEQQLGETLAGLWADNVMFVLDEAGGIPIAVMRTAEAVLGQAKDQGKEAHILMAGNTTSVEGCLYEAAVRRRHLWKVYEITADPDDPKRTPRIDREYARQQIAEYGRENPWVMINILAKFPKQGINTFLSADEVLEAQRRNLHPSMYADFPKILGVDVAQYGDDESVIAKRQGKIIYPLLRMRNLSPLQGGPHVASIANEWVANSIQIDCSGGWGGAWHEYLTTSGYSALGIQFGGQARQASRFANKRVEMYYEFSEWIKDGGALPPVPEMVYGLSTMTYSYTPKGAMLMEDKKQIKARLQRSPDPEDACACTFGFPVAAQAQALPGRAGLPPSLANVVSRSNDYNPLDRFDKPASA